MSDFDPIVSSDDREAWLAARREGITATDAVKILLPGPRGTPTSVLAAKMGIEDDLDPDEYLLWLGREMEEVCRRRFNKEAKDGPEEGYRVWRYAQKWGVLVRNRWHKWLLATLDAEVDELPVDGAMSKTGLEIKYSGLSSDWTDGVPRYVWIQVQHQMLVTHKPWWYVAAMLHRSFVWARVERDDEYLTGVHLPALREFRKRQKLGTPMPEDGFKPTLAALRKMYLEERDEPVLLDGEWVEVDMERCSVVEQIAALTEKRDALNARLRAVMGNATRAVLPSGIEYTLKANVRGSRVPGGGGSDDRPRELREPALRRPAADHRAD